MALATALNTTSATPTPTSTSTAQQPQYIYGSGTDLSNAIKNYGGSNNYDFVDTSAGGFDPSTMQKGGYMLGGTGVNTNVTDSMLNNAGVTRLGGANSNQTAGALANALNTQYIYGSGADLNNARNIFGNNSNTKFVDTSASGFDPNSMVSGSIMLGGSGVNTNVTDNALANAGVARLGGSNAAGTADQLNQYYVNSLRPTAPTQTDAPTYTPFKFDGNMQTYLDQAQSSLAPQLQQQVNSIQTNYNNNLIPQANNDTLSRGLARSSYAGNRVDQVTANESRDLQNAQLANQQQVNDLALKNYNTGYDRAYQLNKDQNVNNWQAYNAQNTANQQGFTNDNTLYNEANSNYQNNRNYNADQAYKQQQQNNWQQQVDNSKNQFQQQMDYNKNRDANNLALSYAQLAASRANAANRSSGSGGRSSSAASTAAAKSQQSQIDKAAQANFDALTTPQDQYGLLNNSDFINSVSQGTYKALQSQYQKNLNSSGLSQSLVQSSQPTWNYQNLYNGTDTPVYGGGR